MHCRDFRSAKDRMAMFQGKADENKKTPSKKVKAINASDFVIAFFYTLKQCRNKDGYLRATVTQVDITSVHNGVHKRGRKF